MLSKKIEPNSLSTEGLFFYQGILGYGTMKLQKFEDQKADYETGQDTHSRYGQHKNTYIAREIGDLGVFTEIHSHDLRSDRGQSSSL